MWENLENSLTKIVKEIKEFKENFCSHAIMGSIVNYVTLKKYSLHFILKIIFKNKRLTEIC